MEKIFEAIKILNKNENNDKKTIIVSITAFEKYECLVDLILNIFYFFRTYNVKILLSIKNNCDIDLNFKNVYIHNIGDVKKSFWGDIELFHQHFLAYKYCINHKIDFDYFTLCTSNQLFFKDVTDRNIDEALLSIVGKEKKEKMSDEEYEIYFEKFLNHESKKWEWFPKSLKDDYFTQFMKNNKYLYECYGHEGLIFDYITIKAIMEEYEKYDFKNKCEFTGFTMEEIFPITYIKNNYNIEIKDLFSKTLCDRCYIYDGRCAKKSLYDIQKYNDINRQHIVALKPIKREFDDEYRKNIRNFILSALYKYNYMNTTEKNHEQLIINYYIVNFDTKHEKEYYDESKNIENIMDQVFEMWKKDDYNMGKFLEEKEKYELPKNFNYLDYADFYDDLQNTFQTNYSCLVRHWLICGKKENRIINKLDKNTNPYFLCIITGPERCGTTYIEKLVNSHSIVFSGFETGLLLGNLNKFHSEAIPFNNWITHGGYQWGVPENYNNNMILNSYVDAYEYLYKNKGSCKDDIQKLIANSKFIFDKTPAYIYDLKNIYKKISKNIPIIIVMKKANPYYNSFKKYNNMSDDNFINYLNKIILSLEFIDETKPENVFLFDYNYSVDNEEKYIKKIEDIIYKYNNNLPYENMSLEKYNNKTDKNAPYANWFPEELKYNICNVYKNSVDIEILEKFDNLINKLCEKFY